MAGGEERGRRTGGGGGRKEGVEQGADVNEICV